MEILLVLSLVDDFFIDPFLKVIIMVKVEWWIGRLD